MSTWLVLHGEAAEGTWPEGLTHVMAPCLYPPSMPPIVMALGPEKVVNPQCGLKKLLD
jgi:hypothetical protein